MSLITPINVSQNAKSDCISQNFQFGGNFAFSSAIFTLKNVVNDINKYLFATPVTNLSILFDFEQFEFSVV